MIMIIDLLINDLNDLKDYNLNTFLKDYNLKNYKFCNSVRHFTRHICSFNPKRIFYTFYNSHDYFNTNFNGNLDFIFLR